MHCNVAFFESCVACYVKIGRGASVKHNTLYIQPGTNAEVDVNTAQVYSCSTTVLAFAAAHMLTESTTFHFSQRPSPCVLISTLYSAESASTPSALQTRWGEGGFSRFKTKNWQFEHTQTKIKYYLY